MISGSSSLQPCFWVNGCQTNSWSSRLRRVASLIAGTIALAKRLRICNYFSMQPSDVKATTNVEIDAESRDTAARICALMRHVFLYDRGNQLRVLQNTGLTTTQCKALLELGGLGDRPSTWQVSELAQVFEASLPAMSRAVDGLVKKELATRVEDPTDRRVRLVRITAAGNDLVDQLTTVKRNGLEAFAASLTATQRRKLDAAVDPSMDREDIATMYHHLRGLMSWQRC